MAESTRWALEKMESANRIFEPHQKTWRAQLGNLVVWTAECYLLWLLVRRLFYP